MLRLRTFDLAGRSAYLDEIRPRFLLLRVRAEKVDIAWGMPLWAAEEAAAFALGAAALLKTALPLLPAAWRERLRAAVSVGGREFHFAPATPRAEPPLRSTLQDLFRLLNEFAAGSLRDVLRVPPGEPYVKVDTKGALVEITAR